MRGAVTIRGGVVVMAEKEEGWRSTPLPSGAEVESVEGLVLCVLLMECDDVTGEEEEEGGGERVGIREKCCCNLSGLGTSSLICFSISASDRGWMDVVNGVPPLGTVPALSRGAGRDCEKNFCRRTLLETAAVAPSLPLCL